MSGPHPSTTSTAVPPLDPELLGLIEDLAGIHPALDLIREAALLLAHSTLDTDKTQTVIAALAGGADGTNTLNLIGQIIARLTNPDTNPALRTLPDTQQKLTQQHGQTTAFVLNHPDLAQFASETSAAITGT